VSYEAAINMIESYRGLSKDMSPAPNTPNTYMTEYRGYHNHQSAEVGIHLYKTPYQPLTNLSLGKYNQREFSVAKVLKRSI